MTLRVKVCVRVKNERLQLRYVYPKRKREEIYLGLSNTVLNRTIAEGKAATIASDIANGHYDFTVEKYKKFNPKYQPKNEILPSNQDFPNLEILWAKYIEFKKNRVAASTYKVDYKKISRRIAQIPQDKNNNAFEIMAWLLTKYSQENASRTLHQISASCKWGCGSDLINSNPFAKLCKEIKPKKKDKGRSNKPFLREEVKAIIKAFKENTYCSPKSRFKHSYYLDYVIWMFNTGMRPEEAIILRYKDIDEKYIYISQAYRVDCKILKCTKNNKSRKLLLNDQLKEILNRRKNIEHSPDDLFFPSPMGKKINYNNFCSRSWKQVIEGLITDGKVKEYLPAYHTKHTFITLCLEEQYNLKYIEKLVGVSADVILSNYAGSLDELPPPSY